MNRSNVSTWILVGLWTLAVVGLAGSYGITVAQRATARELVEKMEEVETALLAHRWHDAARASGDLYRTWERTRRLWALHTDHSELDDITDKLVEVQARVRVEDKTALVTLRRARERIVSLPDRDVLRFDNLF